MITVTNCGHDSHHTNPCYMEHRKGLPDYLFLLVKKKAWVYINGEKVNTEPNMIILFPPGTYIRYGCDDPGYNDDWIHFIPTGEDADLLSSLSIPLCTILYPCDFHRLSQYVQLMSEACHMPSGHTEQTVDSFMHIFLYALDDELKKPVNDSSIHKYYSGFSHLRTQMYNNPAGQWSVQNMADSLHLSVSYFQHLYKQFFACPCQQDIIQARLGQAKFYLTSTEMNIRTLSEFCGYDNELHFMRQFKKFIGLTPSEYRNANTPATLSSPEALRSPTE